DDKTQQVKKSLLLPDRSNASTTVGSFPVFLGFKQFNSPLYQERPLYGLYFSGKKHEPVRITLSRSFQEDREIVEIEEISDIQGNTLPKSTVEIVQQSIVADGKHWLDKGEFELSLK
ncbi:MAG: virulence factor SrfB, partial [Muribaculaceae bacterium]|nr:virulence factor SrfB [Muribaculaceae bacterium]